VLGSLEFGTVRVPQVGLQVASGVKGLGVEPAVELGICCVIDQVTPLFPRSLVSSAVNRCCSFVGTVAVPGEKVTLMPELITRLIVPVLEVF